MLNSLAEEKLQASLRCLKKGGKFLEIGKFDLANDNKLQLELFTKGISFHGVMVDQVMEKNLKDTKIIGRLLMKGIQSGAVKPLPRSLFKKIELEEAFRFMAAGKHMGKVVIHIKDEEKDSTSTSTRILLNGIPR